MLQSAEDVPIQEDLPGARLNFAGVHGCSTMISCTRVHLGCTLGVQDSFSVLSWGAPPLSLAKFSTEYIEGALELSLIHI